MPPVSRVPELRPRPLASPGSLPGDFLSGRPEARGLFPAAAVRGPTGPARGGRLPPEALGASSPEAREKLERILRGEGFFVSTGQQPVLFLGPLYVLYKALAAVELARRMEGALGRPALALFWIASDDHDWKEVGSVRLFDTENRLREVRLAPPPGWEARPAGAAPLTQAVDARLDEIEKLLPKTEFSDTYLTLLRDAYSTGRTLGQAFACALTALLAGRSFAWLDAASGQVKSAARPLLARVLQEADAVERALGEGAERVMEAGYEPAISRRPGAVPLFYDTGTSRERIHLAGSRAGAGVGGDEAELDLLLQRLEEAPERFGPNVSLRPALESWLLPVGATVLGPSEIAYWAQLPPLFDLLGVDFPAVRPRLSWLAVESKVAKVLDKLQVGPEGFLDGGEALEAREVRKARPAAVEAALAELRAAVGRGMGLVEEAVASHLPGIRSAVGKARSQAFRTVQELEAQVDARLREEGEVLLEQIRKAALHLHPEGVAQERVLSPLYYLARYGAPFLEALEERARGESPPLWPAA